MIAVSLRFLLVLLQNLQGLTGTPLVAGSPIRHDTTVQGNPVEVQTYQPPWKALSEFALQSDLDQPAFQQLVRTIPNTYIITRPNN